MGGLSLMLLVACGAPPPQTCVAVTPHDGAGQVRLEHDDGVMVLALETGAENLKVFDHGAPWLEDHWTGREKRYSLWGSSVRRLRRQRRLRFGWGRGALVVDPWRQLEAPVHELDSAWGGLVDAWGGKDFFFALGDQVTYQGGQLCGERRGHCHAPLADKALVSLRDPQGETLRLMVDSAFHHSRLWGRGEQPVRLQLVDGSLGSLWAWPYPSSSKSDRSGTGTLGEQSPDGVLGWADLQDSAWSWDLCTAEFVFTQGPSAADSAPALSAHTLRRNGHNARLRQQDRAE